MADDDANVQYCVCQQVDSGIMIECIRGTGGCNSWVHPSCCGLILTQDELEAIDSYICPLCESPSDDYSKMKALNTKLANRLAKKERKRKLAEQMGSNASNDEKSKKSSSTSGSAKASSSSTASGGAAPSSAKPKTKRKWTCKHCAHENTEREATECDACHLPRKSKSTNSSSSSKKKSSSSSSGMKEKEKKKKHKHSSAKGDGSDANAGESDRRRSRRESNKKKKSYHVPNSDEDLSSGTDDDGQKMKHKRRGKKRRREDEDDDGANGLFDSESDEAEFQVDLVRKRKKQEIQEQYTPTSMIIERIMGVRKREVVEAATGPPPDSAAASIFAPRTVTTIITEYYIKWKGFSYLHCSWESLEVLLEIDPNNKQRIKRFHEKEQHHSQHHHQQKPFLEGGDEDNEMEYFNPEYMEIHRVLADRKETPMPPDPSTPDAPLDDGVRYLVKWRILPYTDATWERACDLKDDIAIQRYKKFLEVPPKEEWEPLPRPTLREYRKLEESPLFGEDRTLSLRAYQLEGLNWLIWNWYNERPSILADEMGLGKTIQTLAFLDRLRFSENIMSRGPFLVVAPLSLIAQWQNECETWTTMNCIVYHGNSDSRELIRDYEFYYPDSQNKPDKTKPYRFNILVTTYEVAIKDISILTKIKWRCLIVDEAHRLKNQASRLVEQMRSLHRDHCVLLTGTPLQNKTEELWALLNFLDGKSFPSVQDFLEKFGDLHEAQQVADLHKMLKPYLLRRVKEDVEKSLPPKEETIIEVELTPVQKQWYRAIYERNTAFLNRGGNPNNVPNLMNVMMELRKCCNHPYLNNGVEDILSEGLVSDAQRHEMMVKCCGKMVLIDKLLSRLKEGGHKVLIFSQMVRVLDIIEDYLRYMGYLHERLDGNIRGNDRQAAVDRFVKPEYNRFVMLLSTKAGGLGLNLTAADTVIIFDSDWNPQNDLQAQARAHRIGQTHSVKIYRLITRKTYEMHMFHKASLKLGLDKAVLTHMRRENEDQKEGKKKSSKAEESKEIDELLKRGAYDVFRDDDTAAEQFCAADIDQILQRSSQVVQYEQQAKSSFSKASFVSATTSDDIDIDDPDFWKKAVGLTEPDPAELADDVPLQRKRTRVSRFGATGSMFDSDGDEDDELDKKDKETEKKEREREKELEKERLAEEKNQPRDWTLNGRDRLQRALMHFGFGRWEIIRSQSGGSRTVDEVEQFAREFIYVLGLSSVESLTSTSKDDSSFIKSLVRASLYAQKEHLVNEEEIPPVLKDEEFVLKLKQGGARRVLIRLDMLVRLQRLVAKACDKLDAEHYAEQEQNKHNGDQQMEGKSNEEEKERTPLPSATADADERVAYHGVSKVMAKIELVDVGERPSWTLITPWWDQEADRNLLMGVFLHGYGRVAQILSDPRLRFAQLEKAEEEAEAKLAAAVSDEKSPETQSNDAATDASTSPVKTEDDDIKMSDAESDDESSTVNGDDDDADTKSQTGSTSGSTSVKGSATSAPVKKEDNSSEASEKKFKQPEVQQMNRLLFWLLSAEDIKRHKELESYKKERAGIEQQRQVTLEKKQRVVSLRRVELKAMQLAQVDMLRHMSVLRNAKELPDAVIAQKIKQKDWTKEERRTLSYLIGMYGAPRILAKNSISAANDGSVSRDNVLSRPFAWQTDSVSWMNIVRWGKLNKTAELARRFFEEKFLPKCIEVANMKADPLASDQRATALADLIGIEFVDAHEGVLAHGLKAKHQAWVTLRRIQLLQDVLDILSTRAQELVAYLRSGSDTLVQDMPVWWCPWIHDLALFHGMARYGIYGWENIVLDRQLPFHREARSEHIRAVFLEGTDSFAPLYRHHFDSEGSMSAWFDRVVEEFPSFSVLERKVQRICTDFIGNDNELFRGERYHEPEYRREFSIPASTNCLEISVMQQIKKRDAPVDRSVVAPAIGNVSTALAHSDGSQLTSAESKARRREFLERAIAVHAVGASVAPRSDVATGSITTTTTLQSMGSAHDTAHEPKPTTSQIPIQMLMS
uniref:Chromodomain-helicase-DNA-binding protein 6 n=1 Tax=Globisporangium ultimum (strain ATCC 200006 / CBS 805.95 / DAOM BR144) TaxID=431595 RepID=K3X6C6_GLOUD